MKLLVEIDDEMLAQFKIDPGTVVDNVRHCIGNLQSAETEGIVPLNVRLYRLAETDGLTDLPVGLSPDETSLLASYRFGSNRAKESIQMMTGICAEKDAANSRKSAEVVQLFPAGPRK